MATDIVLGQPSRREETAGQPAKRARQQRHRGCSAGFASDQPSGAVSSHVPAPSCEDRSDAVAFELRRRKLIQELRDTWVSQLSDVLRGHIYAADGSPAASFSPPRESFNRWLFSGDDASLVGEVLEDLPVRLQNWYPAEPEKRHANLRLWRSVMRMWWADHKEWRDGCETQAFVFADDYVKDATQDGSTVTERTPNEVRSMTRNALEPVLGPAVRNVVRLLSLRRDAARANLTPAVSFLAAPRSDGSEDACSSPFEPAREAVPETFKPASTALDLGRCAVDVAMDPSRKTYTFTAGLAGEAPESFVLSKWGYDKLAALFMPRSTVLPIWDEMFCCLCRYESLCGGDGDSSEGAGLHAALPQDLFDVLPSDTIETFASPFNVSRRRPPQADASAGGAASTRGRGYHRYFSFFEEDRVFGSLGNFFRGLRDLEGLRRLCPSSGDKKLFFECNPPFDVFVMDKLVDHLDALLEAVEMGSGDAPEIAFLVALPEWQPTSFRPESPVARLQESRFLVETRVRRPNRHRYVKGRCWRWAKLPEARGPPLSPGVSKSRLSLLAAPRMEAASARKRGEIDTAGVDDLRGGDDDGAARDTGRAAAEGLGPALGDGAQLMDLLCSAWEGPPRRSS